LYIQLYEQSIKDLYKITKNTGSTEFLGQGPARDVGDHISGLLFK